MHEGRAKQVDVIISLAKELFNLSIFLLVTAFQSLRENRIICTASIICIRFEDLHFLGSLPGLWHLFLSFFHLLNLIYTYFEADLCQLWKLACVRVYQQVHTLAALKTDFFWCLATVILFGPSWHAGSRKHLLSILGQFVGRKEKKGCFPL